MIRSGRSQRILRAGVAAILVMTTLAVPASAQGGWIELDGGSALTASATVSVAIVPDVTPTELRLANDGSLEDGVLVHGHTLAWSTPVSWSLEAAPCPCPDGERTVWAQWRVGEGPWSAVVSDAITLDRTAPTGTVVIDGDAPFMGDPWAWQKHTYTFPSVVLTVTAEDAGPDLPPRAWAVSRDGVAWETFPLAAYGTWDHPYELIRMDVDEGPKTVWVKWQDAAGNWSEPATDTITLRYEQAGHVVVGDGGGYVDGFVVPVRVPVDVLPPEGVASVWVSSDYLGCANPPFGNACAAKAFAWSEDMVIEWDMRDPAYNGSTREGHRRVIAWWVTTTGRTSSMSGSGFMIDREPPVSGPPRPTIAKGSVVAQGSTPDAVTATIRWTTSSKGSPVARNRLQQRTDGTAWTGVPLDQPTATAVTRTLARGTDYRFRVQSTDTAGNRGDWASGPEFRIRAVEQANAAVRYTGRWNARQQSDALGGSIAVSRAQGASASLTFTGRGVAVVAPRSPDGGEMSVYVDGRLVRSAYLIAPTDQPRVVVFSTSWSTSGRHTIRIVNRWDNRDYPIALDAFLVLK